MVIVCGTCIHVPYREPTDFFKFSRSPWNDQLVNGKESIHYIYKNV